MDDHQAPMSLKNKTPSFIPVNAPLLVGNEARYVLECLETGWISSEGPFVAEFEKQFAARVGRKHGVAVANGTAALDVAVTVLDIGPGDAVVLPAFTIISCISQLIRAGAMPILIDSDPLTWNMDAEQARSRVEAELKAGTRVKAIMAVHIYGLPVDLDPLIDLANRYGLKVIEDAAEAIGQTYKGKPCGSFGDLSVFSFYPNKHVTTGEGGMIVTDDARLAERCRSLRNLCFQPKKRFVHEELGWNYRMTNLQAALGLAQLERLDQSVARKRRMGSLYTDLLRDVEGLQLPLDSMPFADNVYWVYGVVLKHAVTFDAEEAMKRLGAEGVGTRPFFWPMHEQPVFEKMGLFTGESYPVAERLARRGFYLPSGLALTEEQIHRVAQGVRGLLTGGA
jgi:perosamine synthetase